MNAIEIVGGGLAGLALGRALAARDVPVTVFEANDYPRHRVCGEFICGLKPEVSDGLALENVFADALRHRTVTWHWRDRPTRIDRLPTEALGISRHTLDERLARSFSESGGTLRTHTRIPMSERKPGRIWATGRRAERDGWLGLKAHCRNLSVNSDLEFHLGDGAYVGVAAVEDGAVNVCGLFRRRQNVSAPPDQILPAYLRSAGLETLAARIEAKLVRGSQTAVAAVSFDRRVPDDRATLGDAFAMIPPFTGDGMAMAFESAWLALEPLLGYARGSITWEESSSEISRRLHTRFRRRLVLAGFLQRLMTGSRGQRCLAFAAQRGALPFNLLFRWLH